MASSCSYLSGAAKRKQRQIRDQNEAKSHRTLEDLNWYTKIQRSNESQSQEVEISSDKVECQGDDTISMHANTISTHITTVDNSKTMAQISPSESMAAQISPGETMAAQVRPGGTIATPLTQVRLSDAEGNIYTFTNKRSCMLDASN